MKSHLTLRPTTVRCTLPWAAIFRGLACGLTLTLSACAVGPDFKAPAAPEVTRYLPEPAASAPSQAAALQFDPQQAVLPRWWDVFQSPALNALVQQALSQNPGLEQANATLKASQESAAASASVFYPQASLGLSRQNIRSAPISNNLSVPSSTYSLSTLTGTIGYAFDFFGLQRRTVEAQEALAEHQLHLTRAAQLTLQAEVINTAIALAGYQYLIHQTQELLRDQETQWRLAQINAQAGVVALSDVLSLQQSLDNTRSSLAGWLQKKDQSQHLLAALTGVETSTFQVPDIDLQKLAIAQHLPLSLPADLVQQRPDILSAQALLHSQTAAVGVATAIMFPSISLNANYGSVGNQFSSLPKGAQQFWNVGPSINLPLFQGGAQWHGREAAIASLAAAQAGYRQTVLNAFSQVADSLTALTHDASQLQALDQARQAAWRKDQMAQANYASGILSYADRVSVKIQWRQAEMTYWQAVAMRHQDAVALFMALGGGWWKTP
jgi:NodT family efflux transporter outer membrane factor (OMF) lipoprotein